MGASAQAYVRRIRNTNKRAYAEAYLHFLMGGAPEPERGEVSYMAAQGVRMHLAEMVKA